MKGKIQFLALAWLVGLTLSAQKKAEPSSPRPAPQIAGTFIDTDGKHQLTLQYRRDFKPQLFTGVVQSTCLLPATSESGERKALELSAIPFGTRTTVFYIRHVVGKQSQNVVLALRFDRVRTGSLLPVGVVIPCIKGEVVKKPATEQ